MWTDRLQYLGAALVLVFVVAALLGIALWLLIRPDRTKGTPDEASERPVPRLGSPAFLRPEGASRPLDLHREGHRAPVQSMPARHVRLPLRDQVTRQERMRLIRQR